MCPPYQRATGIMCDGDGGGRRGPHRQGKRPDSRTYLAEERPPPLRPSAFQGLPGAPPTPAPPSGTILSRAQPLCRFQVGSSLTSRGGPATSNLAGAYGVRPGQPSEVPLGHAFEAAVTTRSSSKPGFVRRPPSDPRRRCVQSWAPFRARSGKSNRTTTRYGGSRSRARYQRHQESRTTPGSAAADPARASALPSLPIASIRHSGRCRPWSMHRASRGHLGSATSR